MNVVDAIAKEIQTFIKSALTLMGRKDWDTVRFTQGIHPLGNFLKFPSNVGIIMIIPRNTKFKNTSMDTLKALRDNPPSRKGIHQASEARMFWCSYDRWMEVFTEIVNEMEKRCLK